MYRDIDFKHFYMIPYTTYGSYAFYLNRYGMSTSTFYTKFHKDHIAHLDSMVIINLNRDVYILGLYLNLDRYG